LHRADGFEPPFDQLTPYRHPFGGITAAGFGLHEGVDRTLEAGITLSVRLQYCSTTAYRSPWASFGAQGCPSGV
jgi:hypothetical protein